MRDWWGRRAASSAARRTRWSGAPPRARRPYGSFLGKLLPRCTDLLVDVTSVDVVTVARQRAAPRGNRLVVLSELEEHLAVVTLYDRVGHQPIGRSFQVVQREIELAVLEIRPADAVEIRSVLRVDRQRALEVLHRLVEPLAPFGQHVTEVVQGGRVLGLLGDQLQELRFGFTEPLLLLERGRKLKRDRR